MVADIGCAKQLNHVSRRNHKSTLSKRPSIAHQHLAISAAPGVIGNLGNIILAGGSAFRSLFVDSAIANVLKVILLWLEILKLIRNIDQLRVIAIFVDELVHQGVGPVVSVLLDVANQFIEAARLEIVFNLGLIEDSCVATELLVVVIQLRGV